MAKNAIERSHGHPLLQFGHGAHCCYFYRGQRSLLDVLAPYVADGLRAGEKCYCVQKPEIADQLITQLIALGYDVDSEMKRGALELHSIDEIYLPKEQFNPEELVDLLHRLSAQAQAEGFSAIRTAGDVPCTRATQFCDDPVIQYEQLLDEATAGKPIVALCVYSVNETAPRLLQPISCFHRLNLSEAAVGLAHSNLSIRFGNHVAEISIDTTAPVLKYLYVVKENQGGDIVCWGEADSFSGALELAWQLKYSSPQPLSQGLSRARAYASD